MWALSMLQSSIDCTTFGSLSFFLSTLYAVTVSQLNPSFLLCAPSMVAVRSHRWRLSLFSLYNCSDLYKVCFVAMQLFFLSALHSLLGSVYGVGSFKLSRHLSIILSWGS